MNDFSKDQTTGPETKPPVVVPIGATLLSILMAGSALGGWVFLHSERNDAPAEGGPPTEEVERP